MAVGQSNGGVETCVDLPASVERGTVLMVAARLEKIRVMLERKEAAVSVQSGS